MSCRNLAVRFLLGSCPSLKPSGRVTDHKGIVYHVVQKMRTDALLETGESEGLDLVFIL